MIEVSSRLRVAPEVARNLNGYLITAFHNRVRARRLLEHRIALEGIANWSETTGSWRRILSKRSNGA